MYVRPGLITITDWYASDTNIKEMVDQEGSSMDYMHYMVNHSEI